jgi:hypothetical protein
MKTFCRLLVGALASLVVLPVGGLDLGNHHSVHSVRADRAVTLGTHQGYGLAYDDLASDFLLAAKGATQAIQTTERGLAHVLARHTVGGVETAGKSIFSAGEDIAGLIKQAESVAGAQQAGGNFARIVDAGRAIGIDRATGQATSTYTVITDAAGNLITAFPGVP